MSAARAGLAASGMLLLGAVCGAGELGAQVTAFVEAGTGRSEILTVAPSITWEAGGLRTTAGAAYSDFGQSGWGANGYTDLSAFTPAVGFLRGEVHGAAGGTVRDRGLDETGWDAGARLHVLAARRGIWIGASRGTGSLFGLEQPLTRLSAGAWGRVGPFDVRFALGRGMARDSSVRQNAPPRVDDSLSSDTLSDRRNKELTDLGGTIGWSRARVALSAGAGRVIGPSPFVRNWWHVDGAYRVTPTVSLLAAVGDLPSDLTRALPGGRYATVSLRLSVLSPASRAAAPRGEDAPTVYRLIARRVGPERTMLALGAPGVATVEIMGDFTDWKPVPLARAGERWEVVLPIPAGVHQANVRFDGGIWQVPQGTTPVADEFGGMVGVFVVE